MAKDSKKAGNNAKNTENAENVSQIVVRLPRKLHIAFAKACKADDQSCSQVVRKFIRRYLEDNA